MLIVYNRYNIKRMFQLAMMAPIERYLRVPVQSQAFAQSLRGVPVAPGLCQFRSLRVERGSDEMGSSLQHLERCLWAFSDGLDETWHQGKKKAYHSGNSIWDRSSWSQDYKSSSVRIIAERPLAEASNPNRNFYLYWMLREHRASSIGCNACLFCNVIWDRSWNSLISVSLYIMHPLSLVLQRICSLSGKFT